MGTGDFVAAILEAPLGVAVLDRLAREGAGGDAGAAVERVATMSLGEFVSLVTEVGVIDVGPWISDAPDTVAQAYRSARAHVAISEAIDERFGDALHRPVDAGEQQWWVAAGAWHRELAPLFGDFERVYGAGQFTWAGLWTVTDPPAAAHDQLVDAWEMRDGPVSRWRLPLTPDARVYEIHRPADWARLVADHPRSAEGHDPCWELPSAQQDPVMLRALMGVPGQRAARTSIRSHLAPDWESVARTHDAIHLSWAGYLTADGYICDLGAGDVAMLRYWFSERTLWLADVFGAPEPLDPPSFPEGSFVAVDPDDVARVSRDADLLTHLLGRRG